MECYNSRVHNQWQPLAFFSKKLKTAERRYSTFGRELLAMYLGVKHFKYFLEGRKFIIFTDHKPLTFSMMKTAEPGSARQQRHLAFVSEFTTDIQHITGKDNEVADALSRRIHATSLGIDFSKLAEEQHTDPDIRLLQEGDTGLNIQEIEFSPGVNLLCDTSQAMVRPLVPSSWKRKLFDIIHNLSHPSIRNTKRLMSRKFVWKGLKSQVGKWAKERESCQAAKVIRHIKPHCKHSKYLQGNFNIFMSIRWVPSAFLMDIHTSSLLWIDSRGGWKLSHLLNPPLKHVERPLFMVG